MVSFKVQLLVQCGDLAGQCDYTVSKAPFAHQTMLVKYSASGEAVGGSMVNYRLTPDIDDARFVEAITRPVEDQIDDWTDGTLTIKSDVVDAPSEFAEVCMSSSVRFNNAEALVVLRERLLDAIINTKTVESFNYPIAAKPAVTVRTKSSLQAAAAAAPHLASRRAIDDLICKVCGEETGAPIMMLCDGCDDAYHTTCCSPPIQELVEGDWFCGKCSKPSGP